MKPAVQQSIKNAPAATGHFVAELLRDIVPKVLFFFAVFMVLFLLFKLFVVQYSVAYSAFAKAAVAALILGKVVPLLDWADSGYRFETHRRIVVIAGKTVVYALVVILLAAGERTFSAFREEGSLTSDMHVVATTTDIHRFLGLLLLLSLVIGIYLTLQELDRAIGKGVLLERWDDEVHPPGRPAK